MLKYSPGYTAIFSRLSPVYFYVHQEMYLFAHILFIFLCLACIQVPVWNEDNISFLKVPGKSYYSQVSLWYEYETQPNSEMNAMNNILPNVQPCLRWRKCLLAIGSGYRGSIWTNLERAPLTVMYFPGWYMQNQF